VLLARHYYAMPKEAVSMRLLARPGAFEARGLDAACPSRVRARVFGTGRFLARLVAPLWPLRVWPVLFPARTRVCGVIEAAPRAHLALVRAGHLAAAAPWLPGAARLLPLGVYVSQLRLRLLPP
jgi:hypothetical protein